MTIQEYAAKAIEKAGADVITAAAALPEDRREWSPLDKGRTALSQLTECAVINELSAQVVENGAWSDALMASHGQRTAALDTFDKAITGLRESTAHLAAAVRGASDDSLDTEISLPWAKATLAELFLMPLWNMSYHEGQINYIRFLAE